MAMTLITTNTSSGAASSSFTSSIDSTYKLYIFKFYDVNPATNSETLQFQFNADGESGYNETITSTWFRAYHYENDSNAVLTYTTSRDQAQGTAYQSFANDTGSGADESCAGELFLFNPSNTTYVKHFYGRMTNYHSGDLVQDVYVAGYINTTAAITNIDFKFDSGNFDGTIKMYGVG